MIGKSAFLWLVHGMGLGAAPTQLTAAERACLVRHATNRRSLVEIGVMFGASSALMRGVMAPDALWTGIDPHPPGRLGVSFERRVAERELARVPRGRAELLRAWSHEAAADWSRPIDLLFIDGDHSWEGIERDWRGFSPHVVPGGVVVLHDSRSLPGREDLDSVRYTQTVVRADERFRLVEEVDSMTVVERHQLRE